MADSRCKYYKQKKQVSYDNGVTWYDVIPYEYQKGELYETESQDCGYVPPVTQYRWIKTNDTTCIGTPEPEVQYRWVNMDASVDYYCEGTTKYYKQKKQVSLDGGQTWSDVVPAEYQKGGVAETESTDCGYVPSGKKLVAKYSYGKTLEVECNSSTTLTISDTKPSGYAHSAMINAVIGNCVTEIGSGTSGAFSECISLTSVTIPNSVTSINYKAFYSCSGLTSVAIPNSVTSIGESVFSKCSSLTNVTIPDSVTTIGREAFLKCNSLTSINIPNGVTSIDNMTFENCTSLTSIVIPDSVTSINYYAFGSCSGLTSCTIGSGVTSIGDDAFRYCSALTSMTISNSVTTIGKWAFYNCTSLTSVTCLATTPPTLGTYAFDNTNDCPIYVPASSVNAYKSATNWSTYASRIQGIP